MYMLITEVFLSTVLVSLFVLYREKRKPRDKVFIRVPSQAAIDIALSLAEVGCAAKSHETRPATKADLSELKGKGIEIGRRISVTEAEHLLGLFQPPSARQIEILKYFKISCAHELSRTKATYHIQNLFSIPANVHAWNQRPQPLASIGACTS